MLAIIQERLKKINSGTENEILISLCVTTTLFVFFIFYIVSFKQNNNIALEYKEQTMISRNQTKDVNSQIFASMNGKTYTFSWCSGANKIKEMNKVFFKSESDAIATGRTLSKLCK